MECGYVLLENDSGTLLMHARSGEATSSNWSAAQIQNYVPDSAHMAERESTVRSI
jgi:hypothetical protein